MSRKTICAALIALPLLGGGGTKAAAAHDDGLALPASCAIASAATLRARTPPAAGFEASQFRVRLPPRDGSATPPPTMRAARLEVTSQGSGISNGALEQAASASAAGLLIALTGSGGSRCPTAQLQDTGQPIVQGLRQGGSYSATWQGVTLHGAVGHVTARRLQLHLQAAGGTGDGRLVRMTLTLEGIEGALSPPTLLPDRLSISVTLPAGSLPTLLAATTGGAPDAQIPVTVNEVSVGSGATELHGEGDATAAATPMDSTAQLHLRATHYDELINRAALQGLTRLHTALFLSRLMGRPAADSLNWDVSFADGLLAVNNVPIPLR